MQDFGLPPGGPLQNPLDDPFEDPFEAMSNAFRPGANFDLFNPFGYTQAQLEELFMDGLGKTLSQLEENIENSQPIPLEPQMPQVPDILIEPLDAPPDVFSAAEQNNQEILSQPTTASEGPQDTVPPHKPRFPTGRIGRVGGRSSGSSQVGREDKRYCPLEKNYVSKDYCEDQNCEYYVADPENEDWCSYPDEQH